MIDHDLSARVEAEDPVSTRVRRVLSLRDQLEHLHRQLRDTEDLFLAEIGALRRLRHPGG
jgi:hypothetical protein